MHGAANSRMRRMTATIALPFIGVEYCASNRDVCRDQVVAGVFGHVVADPETALARVPRDDADDGGPRERPAHVPSPRRVPGVGTPPLGAPPAPDRLPQEFPADLATARQPGSSREEPGGGRT
jgi:hypothetical protein